MLEVERRGSGQRIEEKKQVSLLDVDYSLGGRSGAAKRLMGELSELEGRGLFSSKMGKRVIDVGTKHNVVSAERLIVNCSSLWQNPKFDFDEYSELVAKAYQRFGLRAGGYFSLSYEPIFNQGIAPKEYFDLVEGAVDNGGRIFAGWYAYGLPDVLEKKGDPLEFRFAAYRVNEGGGLKVAIPFILNAPRTLDEGGIGLQNFARLSLKATKTLGKETASFIVRNMFDLDALGYTVEQFLLDTQKLYDEKGEKAAFWYASGFTDLLKHKKELERMAKRERNGNIYILGDPEMHRWYSLAEKHKEELREANVSFNPLDFGKEYMRLLESVGKNAATFYSFSTKKWNSWESEAPEQLKNFKLIPSKIVELHARVNKKVFNSAMWFVLKMGHNPNSVIRHLEDTMTNFEEFGEKEAIKALAYTAGIGRKGGRPFGLELPRSHVGIYDDPQGSLTEERWGNLLQQADVDIAEEQRLLE